MTTKKNTGSVALTVIDPKDFAILDPASNVAELVGANLAGEDVSEFDLDQVKVPSGTGAAVWAVPGLSGEEAVPHIDGIIVHVGKRRQYWKSSKVSGEPPDCHSKDMARGIGTPGGDCEACQFNQFGSAINEDGNPGRGKRCKEKRLVFIVRDSDQLPIVVSVPSGSLKSIKQYLMRLKVPYYQVVTRLSLVKEKNKDGTSYHEVQPTMLTQLPTDTVERVRTYALQLQKSFG